MELNRIFNENCLDTMARMPDGFIDLTVTSPPYDNLRSYNGFDFDFEPIAKELFRVTKQGGVVVWVVGDATVNGSETGASFKQALFFKEIGFNLHDTMIYAKQNPVPYYHNRYNPSFEFMFVISKGKPRTFNKLLEQSKYAGVMASKTRSFYNSRKSDLPSLQNNRGAICASKLKNNIWFYVVGSTEGDIARHPAAFPEKLAKDHILSWSNENDLIYDPFMGSGTTAKAAHLLKRSWLGSEISAEYVEIANKRLEPYLMQESLF